jgi:hypothetical protein
MSRIFYVIMAEVVLAGYLVAAAYTTPLPAAEIIKNEESYLRRINHERKNEIANLFYETIKQAGKSSVSRVLASTKATQHDFWNYEMVSKRMHQAFVSKNDAAMLEAQLREADHINSTILNNPKAGFIQPLQLHPINLDLSSYPELRGIDVMRIENAMMSNYYHLMDIYLRNQAMCGLKFESLEGFMLRDLGSESVNDTLQRLVSNPASSHEPERVTIIFSKKYIDKLIQTLQANNSVPDSLHSAYDVVVNLKGYGFDILPFDKDKQSVSPYNCTSWEFEVIPGHLNRSSLDLTIGIILRDDFDHESVHYVSMPIPFRQINNSSRLSSSR